MLSPSTRPVIKSRVSGLQFATRQLGPGKPNGVPTRDDLEQAAETIRAWPGYAPTPLCALTGLASRLEVAGVEVKQEAFRFEVGSFKALGPPYALERALAQQGDPAEWTAIAASSGNHGRALAWGARRLGARALIFMSEGVSPGREAAIRALGAEVIRVPGDFDDAAACAATAACQPRHMLIGDVPGATPGTAVGRDTMSGYALLADELLAQTEPTHIFVASGNGTLAAATCARIRLANGRQPMVISVEPASSCAILCSLRRGARTDVGKAASIMDGLVVRAPSPDAWRVLDTGLSAALAIEDTDAVQTLREAASGAWGDPRLCVGETGIAALAGLIAAASDSAARSDLAITPRSRLVAILCEGVTDPAVFAALSGAEQ